MSTRRAPWGDTRERELRAYRAEGKSCGEIARIFTDEGFPVSRNAVIGKLHRLKIDAPKNRQYAARLKNPPRPPKAQGPSLPQPVTPRPSPAVQLPSHPAPTPPTGPGVTITDLGPRDCRWPVTDSSPFLCCAAPIVMGARAPYCAFHQDRMRAKK